MISTGHKPYVILEITENSRVRWEKLPIVAFDLNNHIFYVLTKKGLTTLKDLLSITTNDMKVEVFKYEWDVSDNQ